MKNDKLNTVAFSQCLRQNGFTLVEVMITVVIVGVLTAIAVPSYQQYIVKAKRSTAESFMFAIANKQEQLLLDTRTYSSTMSDFPSTPSDVSQNYAISVASVTANTYAILATPNATQSAADSKCGTLKLDQSGQKSVSGSYSATPSKCW
jgi:type IV pilus assembly protein PilE